MKRALALSLSVMLTAYALPVITHAGLPDSDVGEEKTAETVKLSEKSSRPAYDGSQTITLLYNEEVTEITLDKYLAGVLCSEMPASFPHEALKAQAVAARTYTMYKKRLSELNPGYAEQHKGAQLCADYSHCSAYRDIEKTAADIWGKNADKYLNIIKSAVAQTDGQILEYNNEPIAAVFHAVSDGKTENAKDIWGGDLPYLQSADSPGAEDDANCLAKVEIPLDEFRKIFKAEFSDAKLGENPKDWFKDSKRSEAGSIMTVKVGGISVRGDKIRSLFGLNSANFTVDSDSKNFIFETKGRGHGVGMSQYGARRMALDGADYKIILNNYYKGANIVNLSEK